MFFNCKFYVTGSINYFPTVSFSKSYVVITIKEGRKEMFYLTTHSTHFIYGYMASDIWLRTILIVREETHCRHRLLFLISSKGSFICTIPDRIAHTTAFVTPVVEHWLEQEIAQWVHPWRIDPTTHRIMSERSYHGATSRSLITIKG